MRGKKKNNKLAQNVVVAEIIIVGADRATAALEVGDVFHTAAVAMVLVVAG